MQHTCIPAVRSRFLHSVRKSFLHFLSTLLFLTVTVRADDLDSSAVQGWVRDPKGHAIVGGAIRVQDPRTGIVRECITDRGGWYRVGSLPPGKYGLHVRAEGFQAGVHKDLVLIAGRSVRLDFALAVAGVTESIEIRAALEGSVDPSKTVVGITVGENEIRGLPINGRDPLDLVFLFSNAQAEAFEVRDLGNPAVRDLISQPPQEAGLVSISGGRPYSNNVTIDGFDNNDDRLARERSSPSMESIREVQITTNQFSAEYGRASGGRINFLTRRGERDYHGSGVAFFQDESLNANSFFRNARGQPRRAFQRREYAGRFGGPIPRLTNEVFFFGAFERRDEPDTDAIFALLPMDPSINPRYVLNERPAGQPFIRDGVLVGVFEDEIDTPSSRTYYFGRVDANWARSHNSSLRFDRSSANNLRTRDQGAALPSGILNRKRDSTAGAFQDTWVAGPDLINQFRLQFSTLSPRNLGSDTRPGVIVGSSRGLNFGSFSFLSGFVAGTSGFPEIRRERRYQVADFVTRQTGRHVLKIGVDLVHLHSVTTELSLSFGFYNFPSFGDFRDGAPSRYRQHIGAAQQKLINRVVGGFVQDEWRIRPNLSLNLGLRYDFESLLKRDRNNFGPRVSFAWDPHDVGKTSVRGGFGVFYNRILLRTFEDFVVASGLSEIDLGNGPGSTGPLSALSRIGGFPHIFPRHPDDTGIHDILRPIENARSISSDLRIPYSLQASLGIERQIRRDLKVEVNYVLNRSIRLWRDSNVNAPIPPPGGLVDFLLRPPAGALGVVRFSDGLPAFDNSTRQIADTGTPFVRFDLSDTRTRELGSGSTRMRVFGLNAQPGSASATDPILAALNAIRGLRPNPLIGEIEQLQSDGQAAYHALNVICWERIGKSGFLRFTYTLSKLMDNVVLNTSSPMDEFNVRLERSLGLTDSRHRLVMSGYFELPKWLGRLEVAPVLQFSAGRPFNITTSGQDRNLNDTLTDRPHISVGELDWVRPGNTSSSEARLTSVAFPTIGTSGTLGRNAGSGPGIRRMDARFSRRFAMGQRVSILPSLDVYNLTNTPNFIMNGFFGPLDMRDGVSVFMQPRAARRPRNMELGLRVEF